MAERVTQVTPRRGLDPIAEIARADRSAGIDTARLDNAPDDGPDIIPPSSHLAPQGLAAIMDRALGRVTLPTLLELQSALATARERLAVDPMIERGIVDVVEAVLVDEQSKIGRFIALRDR